MERKQGMFTLTNRFPVFLVVLGFGIRLCFGQSNAPIQIQPRTVSTAGGSFFRDKPLLPATPGSVSVLASPAESTNFFGMAGFELAPDTEGSVGTNYILNLLNTGVA